MTTKFPTDLLKKLFSTKINYCRRGMCVAQTISQEAECLNHEPAKGKRYDQFCEYKDDFGKCNYRRRI
jgi:hypothetical protein